MAGHPGKPSDDDSAQTFPPVSVNTGGGTYIEGDVTVQGDLVGRDQYNVTITENTAWDVSGLANPYLGLTAYNFQDRAAFGGRRKAIQEAVEKLTRPGETCSVLFVTGASGCGKSSFVMAGLLPELEAHYHARGKQVRWAVLRPSAHPVAMLADALQQLRLDEFFPEELRDFSPEKFWQRIGEKTEPNQVNLLVFDQFEECFTQSGPAERQWLIDCLTGIAEFRLARTHILLTLRSDYLNEVFAFPVLWELAKSAVELRGMTRAELKEAIQKPLQALSGLEEYKGKQFEPLLLENLARDAAEDSTYLPLLQVTLYRLWQDGRLTADRYHQLTDAIQEHAELVYAWADYDSSAPCTERTPEEQAALIDILLGLVRVSPNDDPRHDVRVRRARQDIENSSPLRAQIISDLVSARLLSVTTTLSAEKTVEWIDIIHESLLTNWPRLSRAIAEQRDTLRQRARFENYLEEWLGSDRSAGYLLAGIWLAEAEKLAGQKDVALNRPEAGEFLLRSIEQTADETRRQLNLERKARQRTQVLAGVLLLVALVAVGILTYPYVLSLFARGDMAYIPAGPVTVGPDTNLDRPVHVFDHLPAFYMDRYEVTNSRYNLCVRAGICSNPSNPLPLVETEKANYPVTWVSAIQAYEFCRWIGGRLPTEIEWERAARGTDMRVWPWEKEDISPQRANINFGKKADLRQVDFYPGGCTPAPEQVCDLLGNASEFTASWLLDPPDYDLDNTWQGTVTKPDLVRSYIITRGFDFYSDLEISHTSSAQFIALTRSAENVGFRCVVEANRIFK